jgi:hypothetical protein
VGQRRVQFELLHQKSKVHTTMVVLPAVNTPQFQWVLSRLPKQAQPVPPIYQPEVPARVIVKAATKYRRGCRGGRYCSDFFSAS